MRTPHLTVGTRLLTCFGLVLAAAGVLIQMGSGVDAVPRIPLSFALLGAAALVVWFGARWWWTPLVAVALCLVDGALVAIASGTEERITDPSDIWPYAGTAMQVIGLIVALIAASLAARKGLLARREEPERAAF